MAGQDSPENPSSDDLDAPAPVAASLRRGGWIGDESSVRLVGTPPPVKDRILRPDEARMELGGQQVTVRTTPPPALRVHEPPRRSSPPEHTATIEDALKARKASAPPAPRRAAPEPAVEWAPMLVAAGMVVAFLAVLYASAV